MSRSGYSDDCDGWELIRWRGAVKSAIKGQRGQQFLRDLLAALDAMPDKRLIADELQADGAFCTLGVIGAARGLDMKDVDPYDRETVSSLMNVAPALAAEIMDENDTDVDTFRWVDVEICGPMRPDWIERHARTVRVPSNGVEEQRWRRMRAWVAKHITPESIEPTKAVREQT